MKNMWKKKYNELKEKYSNIHTATTITKAESFDDLWDNEIRKGRDFDLICYVRKKKTLIHGHKRVIINWYHRGEMTITFENFNEMKKKLELRVIKPMVFDNNC